MEKNTPKSNETRPDTIDRKSAEFVEHDLTYDVITSWPNISGSQDFQDMCHIDHWESTRSFVAIQRDLRELFTKNYGRPFDPLPYKC